MRLRRKGLTRKTSATGFQALVCAFLELGKIGKLCEVSKILQKENPEWFTSDYNRNIHELCKQAYEAEKEVVDWIFEKGELDFLPKAVVNEFIKNRFNVYLNNIQNRYLDYLRKQNSFPVLILDVSLVDFKTDKTVYEEIKKIIDCKYKLGVYQFNLA